MDGRDDIQIRNCAKSRTDGGLARADSGYAEKDEEEQMAENKEKRQALSIEENFLRLEEVIQRLEGGETSLEEAFAAYSEGMKLVKECNDQIDRVEKQVLKLTEEGTLEPLDAEL